MIPGGSIHVDDRHGDAWPIPAGFRNKWAGWLTYREYDIIEQNIRYGSCNMHTIAKRMGLEDTTGERIFYTLVDAGVMTGEVAEFEITPMAKILFDMTDQYILDLDLGEESA